MRGLVLLFSATFSAALGCVRPAPPAQKGAAPAASLPRPRTPARADALDDAPACASQVLLPTTGWHDMGLEPGITFWLPSAPLRVPIQPPPIEGGMRWHSGDVSITLGYGYWGRDSFRDASEICKTTINDMTVTLVLSHRDGGVEVSAVYHRRITRSISLEPLLSVSSPHEDDLALLLTIVHSARWQPD